MHDVIKNKIATRKVKVAIIGAGFGGIASAIRLLQSDIQDFVILEKAGNVGGTWRDNQYPGAACDVQSHMYFSRMHQRQTGANAMLKHLKYLNISKA